MESNIRNKVDFHTHADPLNFESGKKVVDLAVENGVVAVAIFAREQVLPYYEQLIEYGKNLNVSVITGIETLTIKDGLPVQIIGLGFDHTRLVESKSTPQIESNIRIASLQKEFLEQKGFTLEGNLSKDKRDLLQSVLNGLVAEKAVRLCEVVASLDDNSELFNTLIDEYKDLWTMVLDKYSDYYNDDETRMKTKLLYLVYFDVDKEGFNYVMQKYQRPIPTIDDQISEIHNAGGVALYSPEGDFNNNLWEFLKTNKIDGIMAWHADRLSFHNEKMDIPNNVIKECIKSDMLVLGGSDHTDGGDWKIGEGRDKRLYVNIRRFNELMNKLTSKVVLE